MLKTAGLFMGGLILLLPAAACSDDPPSPLDAAFAALRTCDWGPQRDVLLPIDLAVNAAFGNSAARDQLEVRLLDVLTSDAPRAAKDYVCRQLSVMGTARSVPALGVLLSDEELSHIARGALEVISGEEAGAALRAALPQLRGDQRLGVISSLGRRADVQAVTLLVTLLDDTDPQVVAASVAALGHIPAPEAVSAVLGCVSRADPDTRSAAADAAFRVAQRALHAGKLPEAAAIYRLFESDDAEQVRYAALQGLWEAEPEQAVTRWAAALSDERPGWRRCAAQMIRERASDEQAAALCAKLTDLPAAGQVELLDALGTRNHAAVRTAALASVDAADPALRVAAIRGLGCCGAAADVPLLVRLAAQSDAQPQDAARQSLTQLQAAGIDQALLELLDVADARQRVELIHTLQARATTTAGPKLLQLVQNTEGEVRRAALVALQAIADASMAEALVALLAGSSAGAERDALERAVWRCCTQISPAENQTLPVLAALEGATTAQRAALLPALGRLGGAQALAVIEPVLQDQDPLLQDAASRALCNWPDATVAGQLLELARTGARESHRTWAIRAYARVAAREGAEKPEEVLAGLREVLCLASRLEDKKLVLSRLTAVRSVKSLALAVALLDDEQLRSEAMDAAVSLAEGMKQSHPKEARAALEEVGKLTPDPELQTYIAKLLWNMQLKEAEQAKAQ